MPFRGYMPLRRVPCRGERRGERRGEHCMHPKGLHLLANANPAHAAA